VHIAYEDAGKEEKKLGKGRQAPAHRRQRSSFGMKTGGCWTGHPYAWGERVNPVARNTWRITHSRATFLEKGQLAEDGQNRPSLQSALSGENGLGFTICPEKMFGKGTSDWLTVSRYYKRLAANGPVAVNPQRPGKDRHRTIRKEPGVRRKIRERCTAGVGSFLCSISTAHAKAFGAERERENPVYQ